MIQSTKKEVKVINASPTADELELLFWAFFFAIVIIFGFLMICLNFFKWQLDLPIILL